MSGEPLIVEKTKTGLVPAGGAAQRWFDRLRIGDLVEVVVRRGRSLPWHRRYWKLVATIADNTDYTKQQVHLLLKLRCGCSMPIRERNGNVVLVPDSTAFDRMDPDAWADFWERVVAYVISDLLPGITRAELADQVGGLVGIEKGTRS
jgi:hypothetical protein